MNRRLTLTRERLADLSPGDLATVAAGATTPCFTGYYPTLDAPCPTIDDCAFVSLHRPCPTDPCG